MPIYEYRCNDCEHKFANLEGVVACDEAACPKCGSRNLKKLISRFAVVKSESTDSDLDESDLGEDLGDDIGDEAEDMPDDIESDEEEY